MIFLLIFNLTFVQIVLLQQQSEFENKKIDSLTLFDLSKTVYFVPFDFFNDRPIFRYYGLSDNSITITLTNSRNRTQCDAISNYKKPDLGKVIMGVLQGWFLGPSLFFYFYQRFYN